MSIKIKGISGKQVDIFNDIVKSNDRLFCIKASRQAGKSTLSTRLIFYFAITEKCSILVCAPQYKNVDIIFNNLKSLSNISYFIRSIRSSSPQQIEFKNGSTIKFRTLDNPLSVRGLTNKYVFIDEAAFIDNGVLQEHIIPTTATFPDKKIILTSTPFGKDGDFYTQFQQGLTLSNRVRSYEMLYEDNPRYDLDEVEIARKTYPKIKFDQEYLAIFVDGEGSVFKNMEEYCILDCYPEFSPTDIYYAGVDWGRTNDSTVLTIFNHFGQVVCKYKRTKASWEILTEEISLILHKFNQYKVCYCLAEDNGIGSGPVEMLTRKYPNVIPFNTNSSTKNPMIERLIVSINNKQVQLPSRILDKDLFQQMESFEISLNPVSRAFHYAARKGCHDDDVLSLALANYCRTEYGSKGQLKGYSKYVNPNRF